MRKVSSPIGPCQAWTEIARPDAAIAGGVLSRWYRIAGRGEPAIVGFLWFNYVLDVQEVLWYRKEVAGLFVIKEFSLSHHGENFS